ncbi:MAG: hypothetical protein RSA57_00440 [Cetobacterium sp.]|uniref:hypothetical protein n=1 Tax=Cetobacterium sp. TaxID=2071632 RepID=UPI002FCABA70
MRKKITLLLSISTIFLGCFIVGKDFYIKSILTKNLSKTFKQDVTITYAHLSILSQKISLKNTTFNKTGISIKNANFDINFKDFFNSSDLNIKTLNLDSISLVEKSKNKDTLEAPKSEPLVDDSVEVFFKEIERKTSIKDNFSRIFSSNFDKSKVVNSVSENLMNFLLNNTDYIDVIIQKETNLILKDDISKISIFYKEFMQNLENEKFNPTIKREITIDRLNFNGNINNFSFDGNIENLTNNFSKATSLPIIINISQGDAKGQIFGNINLNLLNSSLYLKFFNFDLNRFPILSKYVLQGNISFVEVININRSMISINGSSDISNLIIKKDSIIDDLKTNNLNKEILNSIITASESNLNKITISNNFSTTSNIIGIKTSLPGQFRGALIKNRTELTKAFEKTIETHYNDSFQKKKNSFKNFFKNIKDIF